MNTFRVVREAELLRAVLSKLLTLLCRLSCGSILDAPAVPLLRQMARQLHALDSLPPLCVNVTAKSLSWTT
jgi:hypothetical protein